MRNLGLLNKYRDSSSAVRRYYGGIGDHSCGVFTVPSPIDGAPLQIIASTVVEYHVPRSEHVSIHDNCLHLWRPTQVDVPRPPKWMVGGVSKEEAERLASEAMA